jgi:glucose/arabinose dehydrogenase
MVARALVRLAVDGTAVTEAERVPLGARVRDVEQGPDGALYVLTDEDDGKLLRLTPAGR